MNNDQNIPELLKGLYGVKPNQMRLHSGAYFDFEYCKFSEFHLYDLIHGISKTSRFAGQLINNITVLDHLLHCHYLLSFAYKKRITKEFQFCVLVHDLHEGICCDVPAPLKSMLSDYKCVEESIQQEVLRLMDIDYQMFLSNKQEVKKIDKLALELEYLYGFHGIKNTFFESSTFAMPIEQKITAYESKIVSLITEFKKQ